jgi:RNA polymerase sigma-70 factor (ECF subfamily)
VNGERAEQATASAPGGSSQDSAVVDAALAHPSSDEVVAIVRDHASYVWRTLRFMGVREADLDDACQEVFIVVCRKLEGFEARSSIKTWLRGICLKKAAAYRRRAHVRNEVPVATPAEEPAPDCPERTLKQRQQLALLHRALDHLDDDKRAVFVLYEIEGLAMREVAETIGCALQTAYSRHHAARERVEAFVRRSSFDALGLEGDRP